MIRSATGKLPRGTLFLAFNMAGMLFVVTFLLAPVLGHFSSRGEDMSESAAQLAHFRKIARVGAAPTSGAPKGVDLFLPGNEERLVSADMQANLKAIATSAGVNLLGIRGVPGSRAQQIRMVAVSVEMEGSLQAVRDVVAAIESQTPLLFVTGAFFRSVTDGEDGVIRAELKVQGAMRDTGEPALTEAGVR